MPAKNLTNHIKRLAEEFGFDLCGIARAETVAHASYLAAWLEEGCHGTMEYLRRHCEIRVDPRRLLDGAKSVIVVALLYSQPKHPSEPDQGRPRGRVAMYAWGDDYHKVVKSRLHRMADRMRIDLSEPFEARACVDTAPLLERELGAAAGIGWIGKSTMLLNERLGSFFVLGSLVTTLDLEPDRPVPNCCGTCTACLDACPTRALSVPYEMNASRCISYLTIEHRSDIDESLQPRMGSWIFGCDICQEVCPHNRHAPKTREPRFAVRPPAPEPLLEELLHWTLDDYRRNLRGSAMKRATPGMLERNAAIAQRNADRASAG